MKLVQDKEKCCGCRTCELVCPQSAITMQEDEHGFLYPQIDQEKCIECGLCLKKCAFQNGYQSRKEFEPELGFAARHKDMDIMMESRSGGAFTAVTDLILQQGGTIYGAGYDDEQGYYKVCHKRADNPKGRDEFRGSKYVQSNLNDVFVQVKQDLEQGLKVVFSGTGCQVGALHTYLGKEYENLYTMDIVCHGVPSAKVWKDYLTLREREKNGKVTAVDFRDKKKYGWKTQKEVICIDGKPIPSRLYAKLFQKALVLRPSCFQCIYSNRNRVGDITLADFWGHEEAVSGFAEDNKGVSLVMVNTEKGKEIWESAMEAMDTIECTGYPYRHTRMKTPVPKPENYDEFWNDYDDKGFEFVLKKYCDYEAVVPVKKTFFQKVSGKIKRFLK